MGKMDPDLAGSKRKLHLDAVPRECFQHSGAAKISALP